MVSPSPGVEEASRAMFRAEFRSCFGAPFPLELPDDFVSIDDGLWGTAAAKEDPVLVPAEADLPWTPPEPYVLTGWWGHGVNSYAFYWVEVSPRRRLFLRLPFGGGYMDNGRERRRVLAVLRTVSAFLDRKDLAEGCSLRIFANMGDSWAAAQFADGRWALGDLGQEGEGLGQLLLQRDAGGLSEDEMIACLPQLVLAPDELERRAKLPVPVYLRLCPATEDGGEG